MTPTPETIDAAYAGVAAELDALAALVASLDFAETGPELPAAEAAARLAAIREQAAAPATAVDAAMKSVAAALNAAEKAQRPAGPAAMMRLAQSQATAGLPYPLLSQWSDAAPADWPAAKAQATALARQFDFWRSTVEAFRKRARARAAALGK